MTYEELVQAAKRDPGSVDYTELRQAYRLWPRYDPYGPGIGGVAYRGKIHLALRVGDTAGLIVALSTLLDKQFPDIRAHQLAAAAYERIGDQVTAGMHAKIARGLVDAILKTGDGKSFQSAFQVITISEEYAILDMLKIQPQSKLLCHDQGQHFDVFQFCPASPTEEGPPAKGSPFPRSGPPIGASDKDQLCALYFNVDAFYGSTIHPQVVAALKKAQARRALGRMLGLLLLYSMPILLCQAAALLETVAGEGLPALSTAGTILFLISILAAIAGFFVVLLRAGHRRG